MKQYLPILFATLLLCAPDLKAQTEHDSIRINPQFMNALDRAFSFDAPRAAEISPFSPEKPDKELLHQWVKDPKAEKIATTLPYSTNICIPGLTDHGFAKDIYLWQSGRSDLGVMNTPALTISGLDVNTFLYEHLTPEGRALSKSRALCASAKEVMDRYYPISGTPLLAKADTLARR